MSTIMQKKVNVNSPAIFRSIVLRFQEMITNLHKKSFTRVSIKRLLPNIFAHILFLRFCVVAATQLMMGKATHIFLSVSPSIWDLRL